MRTKNLPLLFIVLVLCGLLAACAAKPEAVGEKFLQTIKDADFEAAFGLCTPDLQAELGDPVNLAFYFPTDVLQLDSWTFTIAPDATDSSVSLMEGEVTFTDGTLGIFTLNLKQIDNQYLVDNFTFEPK
jgi:hypothetical protein